MSISAVLWDMDGTLIDSEHLHNQALIAVMRQKNIQPPSDLIDRVTGLSAESVYDWLCSDFGLDISFDEWIKLKYDAYFRGLDSIREFPTSTRVWQELAMAGVKQAIISNSDRIIVDYNINHLKFNRPKLVTVSRNDVRSGKPSPEGYLRASWLLDVEPESCLVLEDSPTGAKAGQEAGMETYFVPHAVLSPPEGVKKLESMDEIIARACP